MLILVDGSPFHYCIVPFAVLILSYIQPFTYVCGYKPIFQAMLRYLHERRDDCEVVTCEIFVQDPPKSWLGFPVHYTVGYRFPFSFMTMSFDLTAVAGRVLHRMRPDLIHATSPGFLSLFAILWSRLFRIPLIMSYHTHAPVYLDKLFRSALLIRVLSWIIWTYIGLIHSFADLNLLTSPQIKEEFEEHGVPRCTVWQKAVDTHVFQPSNRSREMRDRMTNGHPDDFLIVFVGRLSPEKRLKDLNVILDGLPKDVRLCLVGEGGTLEKELHELFRDHEGRCVFTGLLLNEELSQAFASGDVFVMPSDTETLGLTVLESMASGVPVVAARAGGVQDLIEDEKSSFLVQTADTQAFIDRILQLKNDPALHKTLSENARKETEKWSWEAAMAKLRDEQFALTRQNFYNRKTERFWRKLSNRRREAAASIKAKSKQ